MDCEKQWLIISEADAQSVVEWGRMEGGGRLEETEFSGKNSVSISPNIGGGNRMVSESEGVELPRCLRPAYHFTPATGRAGDPNGLCWYDGLYHLFFLHFWKWPDDTGQSSWGHLVSEDMIRWREAPTAFFPGEAYDSQSCWSGCFRMIEGVPTIFYSGVGEDGVSACLATSEDMYRWSKSDANPLMTPPADASQLGSIAFGARATPT